MDQQQQPEESKPSTGLKIAILVVLIVLLVIGILLPIKIVPGAISSIASSLSSLFTPRERVALSVDKSTINSGDTFTLKWSGARKTNGSYTLLYDCAPGVRLESSVNQPSEAIPCDSQYYFSADDNTIDITALSESSRSADVKLSLGFLENQASSIDKLDDITLTLTNPAIAENIPTSTSTPTVTKEPGTPKPTKPEQPTSNQYGLANLEARLVATGHLSTTGTFVPSPAPSPSFSTAIKFRVVNVGDKNSGPWAFSADLPSATDPRYVAPTQRSLAPGDRIEFVLGFGNIPAGQNNVAVITIDPSNLIAEYSKTNNILRVPIVAPRVTGTQPDLTVRILATGIINRSTNAFTQTNTVSASDRVGIRFEVENTGATQTGSWKFRATLPTSNTNATTYTSDAQSPLRSGERAVFVIGFDTIQYQGANTAAVTVDSSNEVSESNETNNTSSVTIIRN